jgi:hypothetical protein
MRLQVGDIDSFNYQPYLDGELLHNCIMADEERGEVLVFVDNIEDFVKKYPKAEIKFKKGEYATSILYGKVELRRI